MAMTVELHEQRALRAAVALALITGCVDAVCFARLFTVFPANQSGNAVILGIALGHGDWGQAWRPALAIFGFGAGIAVAVVIGDRVRTETRVRWLLGIEGALLLAVALAAGDVRAAPPPLPGASGAILLVLASAAMGLQTMVIRRIAGVAVSTTYETGAIGKIAEGAVRVFGSTSSARADDTRAADLLVVLSMILVAYVAGAAAGAALVTRTGAALYLPIVGLAAVFATASRWSSPDAS